MIDKWFSTIQLPLTFEQFERLPQNRSYKYEYFNDKAWLTPRPQGYHALLDLQSFDPPFDMQTQEEVEIRRIADEDWENLGRAFAAAFYRVQPFASLSEEIRLDAAGQCLQHTRGGGDGLLIGDASFVAARESDTLVGGLLTTLLPAGDLSNWDSFQWREPAPADAVAKRLGRPHLTWIFVGPWFAGHGIGTALLAAASAALSTMGYTELSSTFLLGNDSSMLWHWRMGFRLLPHHSSMRLIRQQIARTKSSS